MQEAKEIIDQLKRDILKWEGFKTPTAECTEVIGFRPIEAAFPNGIFPVGTVHEFLNYEQEQTSVCSGFIAGIMSSLMKQGGACLWISSVKTLFPPSLKIFGIDPEKIIFIDLHREKDILWAMEEALKCEGLAAVVAEVRELNFMQSRRLQLAVETSKVTALVLRSDPRKLSATACTARWQITSMPSELMNGMPGVGFPRWKVDLLKVRNGKPGSWKVEWKAGMFNLVAENKLTIDLAEPIRKVS